MALSSFQLFLNQVQTAPDDLKLQLLQVVFDLLMVYHQEFWGRSEEIVSLTPQHEESRKLMWYTLTEGRSDRHFPAAYSWNRGVEACSSSALYRNIQASTMWLCHRWEGRLRAVFCTDIIYLLHCSKLQVFTSLLMAYVSPVTAENQELRQSLSYFFPSYCYTSVANQSRMQSVSMKDWPNDTY